MKTFLLALMMLLPLASFAQKGEVESKYLAGAVPVNESGYVYFKKEYKCPGKSRSEIFNSLKQYVQTQIVEGENHLPQARLTEVSDSSGVLSARVEEYLYFKRKAWTMDRVRFYYQLICEAQDGKFTIEMRHLHYLYDDVAGTQSYKAEDWITDKEALSKDGKGLKRVTGKFRRFTIDRKDEVFRGAAKATGAIRTVKKVVEVEE